MGLIVTRIFSKLAVRMNQTQYNVYKNIGFVLRSRRLKESINCAIFTKTSTGFRLGIISPYGVIRERNCNTMIIGWNHTFITCTFRKLKVAPTFSMAKCLFLLSK